MLNGWDLMCSTMETDSILCLGKHHGLLVKVFKIENCYIALVRNDICFFTGFMTQLCHKSEHFFVTTG